MFYLIYDQETGAILTFYHSEIHPVIPENSIEITPDQHQFYHANITKYRVNLQTKKTEKIEEESEGEPITES